MCMMCSVLFSFPFPRDAHKLLGQSSGNWRAKSSITKKCRSVCRGILLQSFKEYENVDLGDFVGIKIHFSLYSKRKGRKPDALNMAQGCKPYIDEIVDFCHEKNLKWIKDDNVTKAQCDGVTCDLKAKSIDNELVSITLQTRCPKDQN